MPENSKLIGQVGVLFVIVAILLLLMDRQMLIGPAKLDQWPFALISLALLAGLFLTVVYLVHGQMSKQNRTLGELERQLTETSKELTAAKDVPMRVLIPAFVTSELKTAFQIGFIIFIPFLIIDMVVASVLMSMGMVMMSPVMVSLPFKIMLFVLVDGWHLLLGSLVMSFAT